MTPLAPLPYHNNELAHSKFRATKKKIYDKSKIVLDIGADICYNIGMKEDNMPTDTQPPSQETQEVATLQLPTKRRRIFKKKPCRFCGEKYDPRGLPQHERTHKREIRKANKNNLVRTYDTPARLRLNKMRTPAQERARARTNAKARRAYQVKQRAKGILVNQRNHHEEIATLQLPDNARAIRLAMLYLIKKDTDATN